MQCLVGQELEMTQMLWVSEEGEHMGFHAPFSPTSWHPMPQAASWEMRQLLEGPENEKVVKSEQRVELRKVGRKEKEKPQKV